jgi:hypothetical protein
MGNTSHSSQGPVLEIVAVAAVVAVIDSVGTMRLTGPVSRRLRLQGMARPGWGSQGTSLEIVVAVVELG